MLLICSACVQIMQVAACVWMYMYASEHVCECMHVNLSKCTYMEICMWYGNYIDVYFRVCVWMNACEHSYMHENVNAWVCKRIWMKMNACFNERMYSMLMFLNACKYVCAHVKISECISCDLYTFSHCECVQWVRKMEQLFISATLNFVTICGTAIPMQYCMTHSLHPQV